MLMGHAEICALIPHAGAMCLLDAVVAWDEQMIRCRSRRHQDPANPLRRGGTLGAVHLFEYGAQAVAVHGGLLAQARVKKNPIRYLVALHDAQLGVQRIDDISGPLEVEARSLLTAGNGVIYELSITNEGQWLASGRATIMSPLHGAAAE